MQVAIHAGAAFTDENRLLKSLQKNSDALAQEAVAVIGPRRYRQVFKPVFDGLENKPVEPSSYERLKGLLPADPNTRRVIFSSGDFAGETTVAIQEGQLYPLAGRRMALLEQAFLGHQVELFMGLINPGSFIPKLLMSLPAQDRKDIIRDTDLSCLSWIGMIEDIRDLAPGVQITLWSNEDTPFIWGDIIRTMIDLADDAELVDENDLLLSLLTDAGRNDARALLEQGAPRDKAEQRDSLARIFEEHALQEKIEEELDLPGWSSDIVEAFSELYEQDLARLVTMPGVRVLKL